MRLGKRPIFRHWKGLLLPPCRYSAARAPWEPSSAQNTPKTLRFCCQAMPSLTMSMERLAANCAAKKVGQARPCAKAGGSFNGAGANLGRKGVYFH